MEKGAFRSDLEVEKASIFWAWVGSGCLLFLSRGAYSVEGEK